MPYGFDNTPELDRSNGRAWKQRCKEKVIARAYDDDVIPVGDMLHKIESTKSGSQNNETGEMGHHSVWLYGVLLLHIIGENFVHRSCSVPLQVNCHVREAEILEMVQDM